MARTHMHIKNDPGVKNKADRLRRYLMFKNPQTGDILMDTPRSNSCACMYKNCMWQRLLEGASQGPQTTPSDGSKFGNPSRTRHDNLVHSVITPC